MPRPDAIASSYLTGKPQVRSDCQMPTDCDDRGGCRAGPASANLRAHFCHSEITKIHDLNFRLQTKAPSGQKPFTISQSRPRSPQLSCRPDQCGPASPGPSGTERVDQR